VGELCLFSTCGAPGKQIKIKTSHRTIQMHRPLLFFLLLASSCSCLPMEKNSPKIDITKTPTETPNTTTAASQHLSSASLSIREVTPPSPSSKTTRKRKKRNPINENELYFLPLSSYSLPDAWKSAAFLSIDEQIIVSRLIACPDDGISFEDLIIYLSRARHGQIESFPIGIRT
jgi:hypothetical protein